MLMKLTPAYINVMATVWTKKQWKGPSTECVTDLD